MKTIGGYFGLELPTNNKGFHKGAVPLNTGRNALEYLLKAVRPKKIYLPFYQCEVLLEPLQKLAIPFEYYTVDKFLLPKITKLSADEVFLYINYFGIKGDVALQLTEQWGEQLILDYTQAFFSEPIACQGTFYSARKFFGVSDGAYLYTNSILKEDFNQDESHNRCTHLLKRLDVGAETGYNDFSDNDRLLSDQPIKRMSSLTGKILSSIDYEFVKQMRNANFHILHNYFSSINELHLVTDDVNAPLCYPLLINDGKNLKQEFIKQKIYLPTYWKSVQNLVSKDSFEYYLVDNLMCLPIDQRYDQNDMEHIIKTFKSLG